MALRGHRRLARTVLLSVVLIGVGCDVEPRSGTVAVEWADSAVRDRAEFVRLRIERGDCSAAEREVIEDQRYSRTTAPTLSQTLSDGDYCFLVEALDGDCVIIGSDRRSVTLPAERDTVTMTIAGPGTPGGCPGACVGGTCTSIDAMPDGGDASAEDSGLSDGSPDAASPDAGPCRPGDSCFPPGNLVFATSTAQTPIAIGSAANADTICQMRAAEADLPGNFFAFVSTDTTLAPDRLVGARGFRRVDGRVVADTVAELIGGVVYYPIRLDEDGRDLVDLPEVVFTATNNGSPPTRGGDCDDYTNAATSYRGGRVANTVDWHGSALGNCSARARLFCFSADLNVAVSPDVVASGPTVFRSSATWRPGMGIADADAECMRSAAGDGLLGVYRALLATTGEAATARFAFALDAPVRRADGILVAETFGQFTAGQLLTSINVLANGAPVLVGGTAWTGSTRPDAPTTAAECCDDWSSTAADGLTGATSSSGSRGWSIGREACASSRPLYCLGSE